MLSGSSQRKIVRFPYCELKNSRRNSTSGYLPPGTKIFIQKDICTPLFTAALSIIAMMRNQTRIPMTDECIMKLWYRYTMKSMHLQGMMKSCNTDGTARSHVKWSRPRGQTQNLSYLWIQRIKGELPKPPDAKVREEDREVKKPRGKKWRMEWNDGRTARFKGFVYTWMM